MDDIDYKRLLKEFGMMLLAFVVSMVICGVIGMLTSCKSVKYIPVSEYHTEYKVKTDSFVKRDSVWVKDSVWLWMKGDTVYKERWHTEHNDRYVYRNKTDTVMKTDSVRVPYPVGRELSRWEKVKLDWFIPILSVGLGVTGILLWISRTRRRQ